jgi:pentatricopeptide repeat protein
LEGALRHIDEMHICKIKPNLFSYNALIILYVKRGEGEKAMEVYQTLVKNHIKPNTYTYGWFIQYGLDKNNFEIVDWAFQNMKKEKIYPRTPIFFKITNLCKNLNKDPAREIFHLLTKYNFDINKLSQPLKTLINYCISCKDFTLAEALSKQFGFEYDPNATIPAEQDHAIDAGEEEVIDPSPSSKDVESAVVSDPISIESDVEMNQTSKTYTCEDLQKLLNLFVQRKDLKGVNKVLGEMKIKKHALDEMAYNRLITLYASYGDLKGAYDLLIQMKEQNIPPNVVIYNSLLKYHVDNKDINRAYQLIKEMQNDKVLADQVTRDLMIDLHVFRQEISTAEQLIKDYALAPHIKDNHLHLQYLSPGVSYMMVRQFLQNCLEINPIKIFLEAKWDTPYDELFALKKFILKQIEIYHPQYSMIQTAAPEMILLNKQPSKRQVYAYSSYAMSYDKYVSMIESCIQMAHSEQAYFALRDMRQIHFIPPKSLYDSLLNLYSNKKLEFHLKKEHLEKVFTLLKFMKEDNIAINHKYYKWLIKKFIAIKELEKAHEILTFMQKEGLDTLDCCHLFKQN